MKPVDLYFERQAEPAKSCLLYLRSLILQHNASITEEWKYSMPFYYCNGKMCCYLWQHKKYLQPYIGFADGGQMDYPELLTEKRARMKILLVDPKADIPVLLIRNILDDALRLAALH